LRFRLLDVYARLTSDRRAVTTIEYALVAALVAIVIIHSLITVGHGITNTFNQISSKL
jgi:pilus assembly protein Flp/PilA